MSAAPARLSPRTRLSPLDVLSLGLEGVRGRLGRAALSGLGIAIGIATLVLVTAIPASGQQKLLDDISALGTNILVAQPASSPDNPITLDPGAPAMAGRIGPVEHVSAVANVHQTVRRTEYVGDTLSTGITTLAAPDNLLTTVHGRIASGRFLDPSAAAYPTVVLGSQAARWLGITEVDPNQPARLIDVGGTRFAVIGILAAMPVTPELEQAVFIGWDAACSTFGFDGRSSVVYLTAEESQIEAVRAVLPSTLDPQTPGLIQVSSPSEALLAKRHTQNTFSGLFLGLAGVALVVGGIGVANTMIVSVLERRREIGLRRALGAARGQIRVQFLIEAVFLAGAGGVIGTLLGVAGTLGYTLLQGWPVVIPPESVIGGLFGAVLVGAVAGVYPSIRAARLPPTEALASS